MDVAATLPASAQTLFSLLTDTKAWPQWGPSVRDVRSPTRFVQAGTRGHVLTPLGLWIPFHVTTLLPGVSWHWRVLGLPATGHRVEPITPDSARVVFEIPALAAPYALVCREALSRLDAIVRVQG